MLGKPEGIAERCLLTFALFCGVVVSGLLAVAEPAPATDAAYLGRVKALQQRLQDTETLLVDVQNAYGEVPETAYEAKRIKALAREKNINRLASQRQMAMRHGGMQARAVARSQTSDSNMTDADKKIAEAVAQERLALAQMNSLYTRQWIGESLTRLRKHTEAAAKLLGRIQGALQQGESLSDVSQSVAEFEAVTNQYLLGTDEELKSRDTDLSDLLGYYRKLHPEGTVSWAKLAGKEE